MPCVTPTAYDLELCAQNEKPGSEFRLSWGFWDDVLTFPALTSSPTSFAAEVSTANNANITMKTGKKLYKAELLEWTGNLEEVVSGPMYSKTYQYTVRARVLNDAAGLGFVEKLKNKKLVIVFHHAGGEQQLLGNAKFWAKFNEGNTVSGTAQTDERYREVSFTFGPDFAPYYAGTVPYTPAT